MKVTDIAIWRTAGPLVGRAWNTVFANSAAASRALLDLAFPPACVSCDSEFGEHSRTDAREFFCPDCLNEISIFRSPFCSRCGCSAGLSSNPACAKCWNANLRVNETVALGEYDGLLRQLILRMKRPSGDRISLAMGEFMWDQCHERLKAAAADLVIPVPMHWWRRATRGTNCPLLVAEVLARRLGLPLESGLLRRRRNTLAQSGLLPTQRIRNLQGALAVRRGYALQGARVLLVDDIMTTGATCSVAARSLNDAGAGAVIAAVLARSVAH